MKTEKLTRHGRAIYCGSTLVAQVFTETDKETPEGEAFLGRRTTLPTDFQGEAAARLLAAAPDLLAALKAIETLASDYGIDNEVQRARKAEGIAKLARAAIAKARGE